MLNKLLFASLLALSSSSTVVADSARAPVPPPANRGCLVTMDAATEVFALERKSDIIKDYTFTKLAIMSNGAWTYTETKNGKAIRTEGGCLSRADLATLKSALTLATWKTTVAEMRCMAYAADYSQYSHNGKSVLTQRMCDGLILDKATQKALADISAITSKLIPKKTP
jgi:hypothetical protein